MICRSCKVPVDVMGHVYFASHTSMGHTVYVHAAGRRASHCDSADFILRNALLPIAFNKLLLIVVCM